MSFAFETMKVVRFGLLAILLASSFAAGAIVSRDDVDDAKYRIPVSGFPALADMPGEGHGVLVDPQWVITAAHTIPMGHELKSVVINEIPRDVERVEIHPGYRRLSQDLVDQALATGEWMLAVVEIASTDDIALIKLAQPVTDVAPVAIHQGDAGLDRSS